MKKKSLIIIVILIISCFGINISTLADKEIENRNIINSDISWVKHIIDDDFDYAFGVFAYDVDNDNDCDVLGAAEIDDTIAWWRNDGGDPINWTKLVIDDNFDGATSVFAVDIDNDSDIDVVGSSSEANEIALWVNDGNIPINWTKYVIKSDFDFAHEVYCYDLDLDDDFDILGTSSDNHQISWWRNDGGDPINWTEQVIGYNFLGAKSVRVADIDNDTLLDVIGAAIYDDDISWWRNCGGDPIIWEENVIVSNFDGAHRAEVCDLDFDGDIDIVGAAYFEQEISWWRNDGGNPIVWTKQIIASDFNGACIGLPVDIDEDGDIDVVGTAQQDGIVAVFKNEGGNPFEWTEIVIDSSFIGAWPGFVFDIDGDDDTDIVAGASWADKVAWWESDLSQKPIKPQRPSGPTSGKPGEEYTFSSSTIDPFNLDLYYLFDWGDGNFSEWVGPYNSGDECSTIYTWQNKGIYDVKVKAKNIDGSESYWSDPLPIEIPINKQSELNFFLFKLLFEKFSNLFPILRFILEQ